MIEVEPIIFSDDERELIFEYRKADNMTKEMVRRTLAYTQRLFGDDTGRR